MCVIVDANLASRVLSQPADPEFVPVIRWLLEGEGVVVVGGHLVEELDRMGKSLGLLTTLKRAGRVRQISDSDVRREEAEVDGTGLCRSNDCHVLALARVSGARTLCTLDRALQADFRNRELIANPRGSIYQRQRHAHLLRHTRSCGRFRRRD